LDKGGAKGRIVMLLSNPGTYDERPLKEARSLAKAGFEVTILAWDRERATSSDSVLPEGVVIKRMRLYAGHGTPLFTVPRLFIFYAWCVAHLLFYSISAIHCHDVDTLPAGFAAKVLKGGRARLTYDMHDLPEAFLKFFPLTALTQKVFLAMSSRFADLVVVVNDRFVDYLGKIGFRREKFVVVMNAPPSNDGRLRVRKQNRFEVLYYGWLGEERGVRLLLDAVKGLDVNLKLAGRGELEWLVKERSKSDPRIEYAGWLPMSRLEPLIRKADLIPSLYEPRSRNAQLATPGKLLKSMSLSVPSLVPSGSYQAEIVERFGCGMVVKWDDVVGVREAIQKLSKDEGLYNTLAKAAYEAFLGSYSWEVMEQRLIGAYENLLHPNVR
jgi:glycosyltransferase involved in cell wall biosynthesis